MVILSLPDQLVNINVVDIRILTYFIYKYVYSIYLFQTKYTDTLCLYHCLCLGEYQIIWKIINYINIQAYMHIKQNILGFSNLYYK